jgi:hypothetical protein
MLTELKKPVISFIFIVVCLVSWNSPTLAASKPPAPGETLPSFDLTVPLDAEARSYLGLSESGQFTVPQIEAQVVIIQIFNMY